MSQKKTFLFLLFSGLVLAACSTPATTGAPDARPETSTVEAAEPLGLHAELVQNARITILGEMHGNTNSPEAALKLAKDLLDAHGAVTVALEIPVSDQTVLSQYLDSEGSAEDRQKFLSTPFWAEEYADGRSSVALVELLEELRLLRRAGHDIDLLAFDGRTGARGIEALELEMAEPILAWAENHPGRRMVALVGNIHARLTPVQLGQETLEPMATYIVASVPDVVSVELTYDGGEIMARTEHGFGTIRLTSPTPGRRGWHRFEDESGAYHLVWALEAAEASAPAFQSAGAMQAAEE